MTTTQQHRPDVPTPTPAPPPPDVAKGRELTVRTLWPFFALSFGLTWGLGASFMLFPDQITAVFGEVSSSNPLFMLAVYAPAIAALLLVWRHAGVRGIGSFLRRLTLWRMPAPWWVLLVAGIPAMVYLGAAMTGTIGDPFPFSPWYGVVPAIAFALVLGPMEEFGWRGFALPLLQRRFAPVWAGTILGIVWGVWHAPAFLVGGTPQSSWSFVPYLIGVVAISVMLTPMFNAARGSLLIAALYHFQMMNPAFPDAQPWDTLVFVVAAVVVVVLNRATMFSRSGSVTDVFMPGESAASTTHR